jgi:two-component system, OmpR family, response regulator
MARLLVIDDDPVLLRLAEAALTGHEVVVAASGEEGLERYSAGPFDAVICDLNLPGIQGFDVIRRIRETDPGARILLTTGHDPQSRLITSLRENIVDFLAKPFGIDDLRMAVDHVLAAEEAVEVVSATPQWIEMNVPASFQMVTRLGRVFEQLHAEIDPVTRDRISTAFRELLNNAIEHGSEGDARRRISICYLRLSQVILYRIKDPGRGFDIDKLPHAAVCNPPGEPLRHLGVREANGMRAGGFGILCIQGIADELIYNERGNEVVFARYLNSNGKE